MKNYSFNFKTSKSLLYHLESLAAFASCVATSEMPCRDLSIDRNFIESTLKNMRKSAKKASERYSFKLFIAFREHGFESGLGSKVYEERLLSFTDVICEYFICYDYDNSVYTLTQYFGQNLAA